MQGEGRYKKYHDHHRAYGCLNSCGKTEPPEHHQNRGDKAEECSAFWKQNTRGTHRIRPAANIADTADQHAPTENHPERRLAHHHQRSRFQ